MESPLLGMFIVFVVLPILLNVGKSKGQRERERIEKESNRLRELARQL